MLPITRILVPIDWSEPSKSAFLVGVSLAREYNAQLLVLYVVPLALVMYGPPSEAYMDHLLEELRRVKPGDSRICVQHFLAEGDPGTAILGTAKETNCDLIVMGTHGRTGLNRVLMGSVAEKVVRKATCPVLVVKAPLAEGPCA
jgi:nucleotide-binding universal stress UspA family protein